MQLLRSRIRAWTLFFIIGLLFSGVTALPIPTEVEAGTVVLGSDMSAHGAIPEGMAKWLREIRDGIRLTSAQAPFIFYGTDWLAFGHLMIAIAFVGAFRDPVRNRWLYQFGLVACALVPPWALVFGHIRGIPLWWRVIDSSFGIAGFVPLWLCHRWVTRLEHAQALENAGA